MTNYRRFIEDFIPICEIYALAARENLYSYNSSFPKLFLVRA